MGRRAKCLVPCPVPWLPYRAQSLSNSRSYQLSDGGRRFPPHIFRIINSGNPYFVWSLQALAAIYGLSIWTVNVARSLPEHKCLEPRECGLG